MKLEYFAPGDKAAKCPFCGAVVDLPDEGGFVSKEKITEFEEQKKGLGYTVKRSVRVLERSNVETSENEGSADELVNQVQDLFSQLQSRDLKTSGSTSSEKAFSATFTSVDGGDELPESAKAMMRDMGVEAFPDLPEGASVTCQSAGKKKKRSFWKRLFGKD